MNILINHNGKTNAEVLGANRIVCKNKTDEFIIKIIKKELDTVPKIFCAILSDKTTSDSEKICIFYMVNRVLESGIGVIVLNGEF